MWKIASRFRTTVQEIMAINPGLNVNNLTIGQTICIPQNNGMIPPQPRGMGAGRSVQTLDNLMKLLWEQHVFWTRLAILSIANGLGDTEFVVNRLLRNPKDFEAALRPFYGEDIAAQFAKLFTDHLTIASELVQAAKAGDNAAAADAERRWYTNADQIAAFLAGINPYWSEQEWHKMLHDHLAMTKTEAVDILTQKYVDSINVFDNIEKQALAMAEMMTQGIVNQYSQYFR